MPRLIRCVIAWLLIGPLCLMTEDAVAATLENTLWRVEIDLATLAIRATPVGGAGVQAASGTDRHRVGGLRKSADRLAWHWDEGQWQLEARLRGPELLLDIRARDPGELEFLRQPGEAMGRGLIWPLAEGRYIQRKDPEWQRFMLAQGDLNTTQDLSLPLWGADHGRFTLSWLLTNPYNNRLSFSRQRDALALSGRAARS